MSQTSSPEYDSQPRPRAGRPRVGLRTALVAGLAVIGLVAAACSSDDESVAASSESSTTTEAAPVETTEVPATTTTTVAETTVVEVASAADYAVLVRASLFTDDMAEAQQLHDAVAGGGEEAAKAAGDVGHSALLGTTLLGSTEDAFLGLDQWTDLAGLSAFYSNPAVAEGFGSLFAGAPVIETFERRHDWHQWGDLEVGDEYWWVVTRGRLAPPDDAAAQAAHDALAAGGEVASKAAGDVAHIVFTGVEDPAEFLAIDIWLDTTNLEAYYTNPDFAAAFGSLFDGPPSVGVYASSDWHQW